jgi:DivIVA domain-containing protein
METNEWLLDTPSPGEVAHAEFQVVRRGYDPVEVQAFARAVSAELQRLAAENADLRDKNAALEIRANAGMDEGSIAQYLGEETTRLLTAARDTAAGVVHRAEEKARTAIETANEDAKRMRSEANFDAINERRKAADDSRQMLREATAHRRQMLLDLAARRDETCRQIDDLLRGRDVLIRALSNVGDTVNGLVGRLDAISADPSDFPNLDPLIESSGDVKDSQAVLRVSEGRIGKSGSRGDALGPIPNRSEAPETDDETLLVLGS